MLENLPPQLKTLIDQQVPLWWLVALAVVAILLLLLGRRSGGGGSDQLKTNLKKAENELRLKTVDLMEANRTHEAEKTKLEKELQTLRASAAGKVPPELEELRRQVQTIQAQLEKEQKGNDDLRRRLAETSGQKTMIAPSTQAQLDRSAKLEQELAEAKKKLEAATATHAKELAERDERFGAESAKLKTEIARLQAIAKRGGGQSQGQSDIVPIDVDKMQDTTSTRQLPYLEVVANGREGARYFLPFAVTKLGRDQENDWLNGDESAGPGKDHISRHHATITFTDGAFTLQDRGTVNGTFLNGQRIDKATLALGDVIGITENGPKVRLSCHAFETEAADPATAKAGYRAILEIAPGFKAAAERLTALG